MSSDKSLARAALRAQSERGQVLSGLELLSRHLRSTLGLLGHAEAEATENPVQNSTEIAHGRTAIGGSYTIWVEPKRQPESPREVVCEPRLEIKEEDRGHNGRSRTFRDKCLSQTGPKAPTVECSEGLLTIEGQVLPDARRVRLLLSDGRRISSAVALVPSALGGPLGFYYQALRGPSPIPVRLEELGAGGELLRNVTLPRRSGCKKHKPPPYPAGGIRTIVISAKSKGPGFVIRGERYPRKRQLSIELRVADAAEASTLPLGVEGPAFPGVLTVAQKPARVAQPFVWAIKSGCQPHEFAVLYGLLRNPHDIVLARSSGRLIRLRPAHVPRSLDVNGELAYAELPSVPSQIIVRTPAGRTVQRTSPTNLARERRQLCEGEAEPGG